METQKLTPGKFALNYGLILGLVMIAIAVLMYVTGMALELKQWPQYLYYIIFPVTVIYAISQYKKSNGNLLKLGEAIKLGVVIGVISGLIYGVYNVIFQYVIDTEFATLMLDATRDKMLENPNMTEEIVDQSMAMVEKFMNPFVGSALWIALSAFFGLIYSLIGGLVMKKEE